MHSATRLKKKLFRNFYSPWRVLLQNYAINWQILLERTVGLRNENIAYYEGLVVKSSKILIAIRLPTDATLYFVYLFPFLPYMFRALISPSSGVTQAVFYIQPFGSCSVYVAHLRVPVDWFVVVVLQMVVHKKHLELPLMMGLWEPETCRVKKEINTQNKEVHPLVTLLQYVQKMRGMNNLKFSKIL